jgi:hypothetical protein
MSKKAKGSEAYRDGRKAARASHSRDANPYPASARQDRADWFRGYDEYLGLTLA